MWIAFKTTGPGSPRQLAVSEFIFLLIKQVVCSKMILEIRSRCSTALLYTDVLSQSGFSVK